VGERWRRVLGTGSVPSGWRKESQGPYLQLYAKIDAGIVRAASYQSHTCPNALATKGIKQHSRNQELTRKIKAGNKEARKQGRQFNHQKTRN
jgi:hypothetical protein